MKTTYILIILIIGLVLVGGCKQDLTPPPLPEGNNNNVGGESYNTPQQTEEISGSENIPSPPALPS